jgi:hypothetical protein
MAVGLSPKGLSRGLPALWPRSGARGLSLRSCVLDRINAGPLENSGEH